MTPTEQAADRVKALVEELWEVGASQQHIDTNFARATLATGTVRCPADGPGADGCEAVWIEAQPKADVRVLRIGPPTPPPRVIKLRDLGFQYRVSDAALAEIAAAERRAARVISTAHLFTFGLGALSQNKDADHG